MIPMGPSFPQSSTQIQESRPSARFGYAFSGGRCGRYSAVITSVRERVTKSPKPSGNFTSENRARSALQSEERRVGKEGIDLLLRELDLLDAFDDLVIGERALLLS